MANVGSLIGHFRVVRILGAGGMGEVYEGFDETLHRRVALKAIRTDSRLDAAARVRFLREARTLSQLDDANICRIYDYVKGDDSDLLALEYIEGETLSRARDGLTFAQKLSVARSIARALVAAHRVGVVHRDLKPDNVMLTTDGVVKVLDFGLARSNVTVDVPQHHGDDAALPEGADPNADETAVFASRRSEPAQKEDTHATRLGDVVGTPSFMSPEQARGEEITAASDMYSFGLLLQTLFSNTPPYPPGLGPREVVELASRGESQRPSGADRDVMALIARLKTMAPSDRPTALDALAQLDAIANRSRRRAQRIAAAAALAIAVIGTTKYVVDVRAERSVAERRRAQAEELIGFMVGDLRAKLAPIGRVDALSAVGDQALRYFSELRPEEMTGAEMRRNARTLSQIGEVRIAEGNLAAADAAMRRSLTLASTVATAESRNADARFEMATSEFWVGDVARLRGNLPEALRHYTAYLRINEALAKEFPANREYAIETSYGHSNIGSLLEQQGDVAGALGHYRQAVAIKERHLAPGAQAQADLATTVNKVAVALHRLGRYDEGRSAFAREHDLLAGALRSAADNTKWLSSMARNRNLLAALEMDTGHSDVVLALLREQQTIASRLAAADPRNATWQRNLAVSSSSAAGVDCQRGDFRAAEAGYTAALARMEPLRAKDPTRSAWALDVVAIHYGMALVKLGVHDVAAAQREIASARTILQSLKARDAAARQTSLELALAAGSVAAAAGDTGAAQREWWSVIDTLSGDHSLDNAKLAVLARALIFLGRSAEAAPIVDRLLRSGYRNADLVNSWVRVAH